MELSTDQLDSIAIAAEGKVDEDIKGAESDDNKDDKDDSTDDNSNNNDDAAQNDDNKSDGEGKDKTDDDSDNKDDKDNEDNNSDDSDDDKLSDEEIIDKPDEDLSAEQIDRKNELIEDKDKRDKAFEVDVKALSEEKNISADEAKEQLEAEDKFSEKYGKDPRKLARTARELQQINSKHEAKIKELEEKSFSVDLNEGEIMIGGKVVKKNTIIDAYLKEFPKEKERALREYDKLNPDNDDEDDEKWGKAKPLIFNWIKQDLIEAQKKSGKEQATAISSKAKEKRESLISKVPESDKKYVPSVQKILDHTPDGVVIGESFDIQALLNHERGKVDNIKSIQKEYEEKGYKRGLEKANILGTKGGPEGRSGKQRGKGGSYGLSREAQNDALRMFSGSMYSNMSDSDKFREYSEMDIGDLKTK